MTKAQWASVVFFVLCIVFWSLALWTVALTQVWLPLASGLVRQVASWKQPLPARGVLPFALEEWLQTGGEFHPAVLDASAGTPRLRFDDSQSDGAQWVGVFPRDFAGAGELEIVFSMASATTGAVALMLFVDDQTMDKSCLLYQRVPATAGHMTKVSCPVRLDPQTYHSGQASRLKLKRIGNSVQDTAAGDMEVRSLRLRYTPH